MAVQSLDHSFRWAGAAGPAVPQGHQATADTPFFIASIDKLLNAALVMKLSESSQIDLEGPAAAYLPHELMRGIHRLRGADCTEQITIRHLLSHTSGLPDWLEDRPPGGGSVVEQVLRDGDRAFGLEDVAKIVRELTPHFAPQDRSIARPRVRYSDTNYMLLIAIIEAVTARPLHEVYERLLLRPLGMHHTWLAGRSSPLGQASKPAALCFEGRELRIPQLMRSLWAVYSTTGDLLTFLCSLVRGEIFDAPGSLAAMQQRWNRFGFPLDRAALRAPGWPIAYGLGIMRFSLPRLFTPFHPIPPVIGHSGSTGCWLFYCPQLQMLLAGSVDEVTAGAVPYRVVPKVLRIL